MKPEWIIYKNDQKIGQAVTWYKALDNLMKSEGFERCEIWGLAPFKSIKSLPFGHVYKIVKER